MPKILALSLIYFAVSCGSGSFDITDPMRTRTGEGELYVSGGNTANTHSERDDLSGTSGSRHDADGKSNGNSTKKSKASSSSQSSPNEKEVEENSPALPPSAIAGSFLSDCFWSNVEDRVICRMGKIGGNEHRMAQAVEINEVENLQLYNNKTRRTPAFNFQRMQQRFLRLGLDQEFKANKNFARFDVKIEDKKLAFGSVEVTHIPPKRNDSGNGMVSMGPQQTEWNLPAFKIGDDGLGVDVECPMQEKLVTSSANVGRKLFVDFEISDATNLGIQMKDVCGNARYDSTDTPIGRIEIWEQDGELLYAGELPVSEFRGNSTILTAQNAQKIFDLGRGRYTLVFVPGPSSNQPGRLNDYTVAGLKLLGHTLNVKGHRFK